jgi:hypothetical protein
MILTLWVFESIAQSVCFEMVMAGRKKWGGIWGNKLQRYEGGIKVAAFKFTWCSNEVGDDWPRKRKKISKRQPTCVRGCTESLIQSNLPQLFAPKDDQSEFERSPPPNPAIANNLSNRTWL